MAELCVVSKQTRQSQGRILAGVVGFSQEGKKTPMHLLKTCSYVYAPTPSDSTGFYISATVELYTTINLCM